MRFLLAIALLLPLGAAAQSYQTLSLGTNAVPNEATNTVASSSVDAGRQTSYTLFASCKCLTNPGTGTLTLRFQGSPDDSTYFTNAYALDLTLNGTNTVSGFANLNMTPFKWSIS